MSNVSGFGNEARGNSRRLFLTFCLLTTLTVGLALVYILDAFQAAGRADPVMPLDDVYIHFQYGRALAEGHPFHYNADQPATSGATSLLYPALLAVGYSLGFQGERLGWWALSLGVLCWVGSAWLVYRIGARKGTLTAHWIGLTVAVGFVLAGSLGWAFVSGMETGLAVFAALLTLWYIISEDRRGALAAGILATLIRPEGVVVGGLAAFYMATRERSRHDTLRHLPIYALPFLAVLIQPGLNYLFTGSAVASGMQSKSHLYDIIPLSLMLDRIFNFFVRAWQELLTGFNSVGGDYGTTIPFILTLIALVISLRDALRARRLTPPILVFGWLVGISAAVSLLETSFWHFKRYHQPMIALLFPPAAWGLTALYGALQRAVRPAAFLAVGAVLGVLLVQLAITTGNFVGNYRDNVREVALSQIPMAEYAAKNLPGGAIVGVHDIGVMRYLGDHPTYDVIGLTTPGAALAWRNGPGAAYEQMARSPWRPAYFAIYPDARGLTYFTDTGLFREALAHFPSTRPIYNVASATNTGQTVYRTGWTFSSFAGQPWQPSSLHAISGMSLIDSVNCADLESETAHGYRWWQTVQRPGFATEVYEWTYAGCRAPEGNAGCRVLDGGRLITGGEEMTITTRPGQDLIWVTRVHPRNVARLEIFVDGQKAGTRLVPAIPGQWLEIATLVPGSAITKSQTRLRVEANITDPNQGHYMPYYHWFYQGTYRADTTITLPGPTARFGEFVVLAGHRLAYNADKRVAQVDLEWRLDGPAETRDAKVFVHIYDPTGKLIETPGAQIDRRPGEGTLPPANWLPDVVRDSYTLFLPEGLTPGTYRVAVGLYDPEPPMQRWPVQGEGADSDRRLFIGTIEIR